MTRSSVETKKNWINGEFRGSSTEKTFQVVNPATEEVLAEVQRSGERDVRDACQAARDAQLEWWHTPGIAKAEILHRVAAAVREQREELARIMTEEGGKPLLENRDEVEWVAACFDYYAEVGRDAKGRVIAPVAEHQFNYVVKEPFGVIGCIVPWNYPLLLMGWKVAPAIAAGNTVVIKPSEMTPLSTLAMSKSFSELPNGVVNIVTGYGKEAGEPLCLDRDVDMIAFTGSIATGKHIMSLCAQNLKKVNLEMGGNDPFIVCDDVDLDIAARGAVWAAYLNNGQVCTSAERFYIFESVADEFIAKFTEIARSLRLGNPMGPNVDLGPMISAVQRDKVEQKLQEARGRGAKIVAGGNRPAKLPKGFFLEPAVVTGVDHTMTLMKEETFGPVAPIMRVSGIEEAVKLANDSEYGLGANIYTNNLEYAMMAMENVKAGTFWINDPLTDNDAGPFGGMRKSGMGRELGVEGLEAFRDTKHVHMDYKISRKPYWFPYDWSHGRKTE